MRPSFDQLPEKKQQEILLTVEVIKQVIDPEMIILFGSYAKGTWVDQRYHSGGLLNEYTSDYDFLVVTQTNKEDTYVQEHQILQKVDHFDPPVNLEIHSVDHINKGLEWGQYYWVEIIKEGIVLHDKKTVQFNKPRELTTAERKEKALQYFETWFPAGIDFFDFAKIAFEKKKNKKAAFFLHQTAENLYYTVLTVFTDYKPKIHNLWKLRKKAKPYSEDLYLIFRTESNKYEERLFESLKQGYIEARYDPKFSINEEDLTILTEKIELMIPIVEQICKSRIENL